MKERSGFCLLDRKEKRQKAEHDERKAHYSVNLFFDFKRIVTR